MPAPKQLTRHRYDVVAEGPAGKVEIAVLVNGKVESRLPVSDVGLVAVIPRGGGTYTIEKVKGDATGMPLAPWQLDAMNDVNVDG